MQRPAAQRKSDRDPREVIREIARALARKAAAEDDAAENGDLPTCASPSMRVSRPNSRNADR